MNNRFQNTFVLQAALIMGCLFFSGCENDPRQLDQSTENRSMVDEATGVESLMSQDGKPRASLKAPYMLRYNFDTAYIEFPKGLKVNFFDSSGAVESRLTALYGKHFETRSKVFLRDSVTVTNVKGDTLRAPELWWDQTTRKFYTDKFVRLKTKDKTIYGGKGLEAEQDLSRWTIFKPTGMIVVPDSMAAQ